MMDKTRMEGAISMGITKRCMASVYLLKDDHILLLYRQGSRVVNNVWIGSAGGHMEPQEIDAPEFCVLREMREELGLSADDISPPELRYITLRMTNGEIRENHYYFAQLRTDGELASNEGQLRWFHLNELADLPMAYTARYMIDHWLETGRHTECIYGGVADGEKLVFTELFGY